MDIKTFNRVWAIIMITSLIAAVLISLFYVPYNISHDQHMVDTINERAFDYGHPEGVITDFTEAEIMSLDAQEEYEEKVWMLDNQELYWLEGLTVGILIGSLTVLLLWALKSPILDYYYDDDCEDEDDEEVQRLVEP
ncbi:hypothetical protein KAU43_04240 [candidate division WOR-3 bacterium]|nr:hypothetical protein [candidate division WOR-3 bacterium]